MSSSPEATAQAPAGPLPGAAVPRRVLIVTDEMEVGGTQRQIVHLARGLRAQGDVVQVIHFRNRSFLADELEAAGVPCIEVPKQGRLDPGFVLRLRAAIAAFDADVLHAFAFSGELWASVATALLPARRRPVLVSSVRGVYEWYRGWQWRAKRWVSGRSAAVVSNSQAAARYAEQQMGLADGAVRVVYNGSPVPALDDAAAVRARLRAELGIAEAVPLALFVGRLVDHKNLPMLLDALHRLQQQGSAIRLAIVGDGPLRAEVEAQRVGQGLQDRVSLLGERSDVPALMTAADFVVLTSLREGLSNIVLEAMMAGRAVIATRVGGNVELVQPGQTGLLVESGDAAGLAAAMQALADDAALRERLGTAARGRGVAHFGIPAMVAAYRTLYGQLCSTAPAARAVPARAR